MPSEIKNEIVYSQMKAADRRGVLSFLRGSYPETPRQSDPQFWDWHFIDQPIDQADEIPVFLAKSGDRIAGQLAAIRVGLSVAGRSLRSMWILDLLVDPDFRRRGIMKQLVGIAERHTPYLLGVNTNKQHAPALLMGLGWGIVTKIPRYHKILFPGNAIKEIGRFMPLRWLMNLAFAPFRRSSKQSGADIRQLNEFDQTLDEFWNEARGQWPC